MEPLRTIANAGRGGGHSANAVKTALLEVGPWRVIYFETQPAFACGEKYAGKVSSVARGFWALRP